MNRKVVVYENSFMGWGCFQRILDITDENFVAETDDTITIKDTYTHQDYGETDCETCYVKTIDLFLERENKWFANHIKEITERHNKTLEMAEKLRKK